MTVKPSASPPSPTPLCGLFVEQVPVSGASITVFADPGAQSTICVSDGLAVMLDQLQFDLGEGPRWEVARTGRVSLSVDLVADEQSAWPIFSAAAAQLGVGAVFAFPMRIGQQLAGVADLYRREAGPLGNDATSRAVSLAHRVARPAIEQASRSAESHTAEERDAPALRREVHQATGMILAQLEIGAAEAFALLQAHAFAQGRTVDDVARDVVQKRIDFRDIS